MTQRDKSLQTEAVWSVFTPAASDCGSVRNYPEQNVTRWCRALFIPMHVCVCYNVIRVYCISVHAPTCPHQQPRVPTTFHPLPARRYHTPTPPAPHLPTPLRQCILTTSCGVNFLELEPVGEAHSSDMAFIWST